jgi:UbiD family decarboxylase
MTENQERRAESKELRTFLDTMEKRGEVIHHDEPVGAELQLAHLLAQPDENALRVVAVEGFSGRAVSGVSATRKRLAHALGTEVHQIVDDLQCAVSSPGTIASVEEGEFHARTYARPDLAEVFPYGRFYPGDGGPYSTSFMLVARSRDYGLNVSFHRMMHLGGNRLAVRVVRRHLHQILRENDGEITVAGFSGVHPAVLLAAAMTGPPDLDELTVASALLGHELECVEVADGLFVPAASEVVFVGRFTGEQAAEGPFVDLTHTYDHVREQPVLEVDTLWTRPDPLYHVILPGGPEHKLLMGLPREPAIRQAARSVVPSVREVCLTPGGCGWLHAVVSAAEMGEGQAVNVGMAALAAHPSLKRVVVVDDDIDIHDPSDVEWAMATRVQPERDITVISHSRGSTLDPSRDQASETTSKWIVDATAPAGRISEFARATLERQAGTDREGGR